MAKRDIPTTPASGSARSRQRGKPVQVQPKKPIGAIVGGGVLGLALIGIVAYAVTNQGAGFEDPLVKADSAVEGVTVADEETLTRDHVEGAVEYPLIPPVGGNHASTWQNCQVYAAPIPNERAVHSLEHGAVWITYQDDLPAEQVATLRGEAEGRAYVLMSPVPEQDSAVAVSAWGRQLTVDSADDPRVEDFVKTFANGPQTPEKGAACSGGSSETLPAA